MPYVSKSVLIVDPVTKTADTTTIPGISGDGYWYGGVLGPDGRIYGIPFHSESVLIIDEPSRRRKRRLDEHGTSPLPLILFFQNLEGNRLCRLRIPADLKAAGVIHPGKKGLFLLGLLTLLLGPPDFRL